MSHHEEESTERSFEFGGTLAWFLAGAAIGAGVALLLAPRSGKDTREFIGHKAQEGGHAVAESGRDFLENSVDLFNRSRQLVEDAVDLFERGRRLARG